MLIKNLAISSLACFLLNSTRFAMNTFLSSFVLRLRLSRSIRMPSSFLAVCLLCTASFAASNRSAWYVDNRATGLNLGTNWENAFSAWSNINWRAISPGDTIYVSGGTNYQEYEESFFIGTRPWDGKPGITVKTGHDTNHSGKVICRGISIMYGAHNTIIDGTISNTTNINFISKQPVTIYDSTNVLVRSVEVDRSASYAKDQDAVNGIGIHYNVDHVIIDHCYIHDTSGDGINVKQPLPFTSVSNDFTHFIITNCTVTQVGDDGIQVYVPNVTVANCVLDKAGFPTMFGGHPDGIEGPAYAGNVWLAGNRVCNFNQNIFLQHLSGQAVVINNILAKSLPDTSGTDRGIYISPWLSTNSTASVVIANNLFFGFNTYIALLLIDCRPQDIIMVDNNIFMNCRVFYAVSSSWSGTNNVFFSDPSFGYYNSGVTTACPLSVPAWAGLYQNPLLIDPLHGNFQLTTNSPCIDTGTTLDRSLALDIRGLPRPQGKGWDVGPYEFGVFPASVRLKQP